MTRSYYHCCCINEPVIFSHCVHLKLGHLFHYLLKLCSDRDDTCLEHPAGWICARYRSLFQSNPIQSTFVKRHQSSWLFRGASQKHRGKPLLLTISELGSFTCITQHTGPTSLRPIRRTKQLWLSVLLKDTLLLLLLLLLSL